MLYHPGKIAAFGRLTLARGIAAVVVGFPATPLLLARARICISAAHSRQDLDRAIAALEEVADECALKYNVSLQPSPFLCLLNENIMFWTAPSPGWRRSPRSPSSIV